MHERPDSRKRLVVVQAKLREQLLECYLVLAVGKGRAFETEPDRGRRARLSLFHPHQARLRVDETPDEPSGGEPIGQEGFAGGPKALEVIAPRLGQAAGVGSVWKHPFPYLAFRITQHLRSLLLHRRTKEIQRADRFEFTSLLVENSSDRAGLGNSETGAQPFDGFDQFPVFSRPVKERRSEEHTSELQSLAYLVCRLLLEKKKQT